MIPKRELDHIPVLKQKMALIMKGGGIKGIAYVGALEVLEKHYTFDWFVGTSAGAISAILLSCGYSVQELKQILFEKDFTDFKDASWIKRMLNLIFKKGLYEANTFTSWIDCLLSQKLKSPLQIKLDDLPYRTTVYASQRGLNALVFDSENPATRDTSASFAARCSMSIPFIFVPQQNQGLKVFDGGAQNNFPVEALLRDNPNSDFLGLYLGKEYFENDSSSRSIIKELISIWTEAMDHEALRKYIDKVIIMDTRPISTLNFSLSTKEKEFLLDTGRLSAIKYLIKNNKISDDQYDLQSIQKKVNEARNELMNKSKSIKARKVFKYTFVLVIVVTIAIMVMIGKEENDAPVTDSFPVTVLVHGKEGKDHRILKNQGKVVLDFGTTREEESINEKGEATFKEIPTGYIGKKVIISLEHPQPYLPVNRKEKYLLERGRSIYLEVELKGINNVYGRVFDFETEKPLDSVRVSIQNIAVFTDQFGWFELTIPPDKQAKFVRINFFKEGYIMEDVDSITPHTKQEIGMTLKRQ